MTDRARTQVVADPSAADLHGSAVLIDGSRSSRCILMTRNSQDAEDLQPDADLAADHLAALLQPQAKRVIGIAELKVADRFLRADAPALQIIERLEF